MACPIHAFFHVGCVGCLHGQPPIPPRTDVVDAVMDPKYRDETIVMRGEPRPAVANAMYKVEQHGNANKPGQGVKADAGKAQFEFIPFDLLEGENRVWALGAKKYTPNNWRNGMPMSQPFNALQRHLAAYMRGEDRDPETGESHLDHAACCLRMMQNTERYYPHLDDRHPWTPPKVLDSGITVSDDKDSTT